MEKPWLFWTPRILALLFVGFLALFSFDVFSTATGWEAVLALLIHNIPDLVLLAVVVLAWKRPVIGAFGFLIAGFSYIVFLAGSFEPYMFGWMFLIAGPAFLVSGLFYADWYWNREKRLPVDGR